jgi:hypothetical protein
MMQTNPSIMHAPTSFPSDFNNVTTHCIHTFKLYLDTVPSHIVKVRGQSALQPMPTDEGEKKKIQKGNMTKLRLELRTLSVLCSTATALLRTRDNQLHHSAFAIDKLITFYLI